MNYQQKSLDGTKTWCRFVGGIMDGHEAYVADSATWAEFPKLTLAGLKYVKYRRCVSDQMKFIPDDK